MPPPAPGREASLLQGIFGTEIITGHKKCFLKWIFGAENAERPVSRKCFVLAGDGKFSLDFRAIFENLEKSNKKKKRLQLGGLAQDGNYSLKFRAIFENFGKEQKKKTFDFQNFVLSRPFFRRPVLTSKKKTIL